MGKTLSNLPGNMKSLIPILSAVVGSSVALPLADNPAPYAPAPYAPAPYKPAPYHEKELPPQPYQFEYGVADQYSGTNFQAAETQDPAGTVLGSYTVNLPDGRVQTVTYKADHQGGFVADVKYEGEAQYPPEPAEGYGNTYKAKSAYKPAPYKPAPYKPAPYQPAPSYEPAPVFSEA